MLKPGSRVFFQRPEEFSARTLHPGVAISVEQTKCAAWLEAPLPLEVDQSLLIYFEVNREFVQQPIRITIAPREEPTAATGADPDAASTDLASEAPPHLRVDFETTGFVMSAESRQCYRVTTLSANLTAKLGGEETCPLLDVSASGFSVVARASYGRGDIVRARLQFEDKVYTGKACVQSIKQLMTGETRYGLTGLEAGRGSIGQGQGRITIAIQREQLRRQRGTQ